MDQYQFINITHPSEKWTLQRRREVKSFISKRKMRQKQPSRWNTVTAPPTPPTSNKADEVNCDEEVAIGFDNPNLVRVESDPSIKVLQRLPRDVFPSSGNLRCGYHTSQPMAHSPPVSVLLDYYVQFYGPTHVWRAQLLDAGALMPFTRSFFQYSLQQPMLLEIAFALCLAQIDRRSAPDCTPSSAVTCHHGNALRMLREALVNPDVEVEDAILFTVIALLAFDMIYMDWTSFEAHLKGLRQLVKIKGGADNLGWYGWLSSTYIWAELCWQDRRIEIAKQHFQQAPKALTYPAHPYFPTLCATISALPEGFRDLALSARLSLQVVHHLHKVTQWMKSLVHSLAEEHDSNRAYLDELKLAHQTRILLETCSLTQEENLACVGAIGFIITHDDRVQTDRHPKGLTDFIPDPECLPSEIQLRNVILWMALVVAAAEHNGTTPSQSQSALLDHVVAQRWYGNDWAHIQGAGWLFVNLPANAQLLSVVDGETGAALLALEKEERPKLPDQQFESLINSVQVYARKLREQPSSQEVLDKLNQIHTLTKSSFAEDISFIKNAVNHTATQPSLPRLRSCELTLEFPESRALWLSKNAHDWKDLYLAKRSGDRLPHLAQCIHDVTPLSKSQDAVDLQMSILIILYGIWTLIWEYRQLNSVSKLQPPEHRWNGALMSSSWHQELCQLLYHFRMHASEWENGMKPEAILIQERSLMNLHVSFEDVQLFAGKEGEEEARRAYPLLKQWAETRESRQVVWHAGQVLKASAECHPKQLRDFLAIALYHASLAFWAYAVISRPSKSARRQPLPASRSQHTAADDEIVWLDGEDGPDVQRFIAVDRGTPVIRDWTKGSTAEQKEKYAALSDVKAIMDIIIAILRQNGKSDDRMSPPLVNNLSQLMRNLSNAALSIGRP